MNTRNKGNYNRGFYRKLNNQTIITLEKHHPHVQKIPINYNKFISKINEQILKKLKYSKKTSPVCIFKIDIEENIYTYLKEQFNITGRFKTNIAFHESFPLKQKRFANHRNYCDFDTGTFQVKISKRKPFNYFEEDMIRIQIKQSPVFTCRYIRRKHVIC